ncbi:glyoxylase-like metal-dependent hydrolase (beta-lactamase superfamily II) [Nocardioides ginsengisegetis]|uniref:Glyoxylase-like metal-dependent hydrolase (Beta-lactamase superfamily II) n=1 Tax=Nocardioides ginsengisegetis TaxID=661491 RepID=A0A7W3IZN2_9ACTN|nr:glyoxylase-like metal-dependent hydrolase (beta-lactamase superfamily II) [Nocardioides ginsengisegetis]
MVTYTGDVSPGGSPDVREAGGLRITKVAVDEKMSNNCYLLTCRATGAQVLVDAAAEPETLLPLVGEAGLTTVVTTHQHWDHHRALKAVVDATGAEVAAGVPDADAITEQTGVEVTRPVRQGDVVRVGEVSLEVIAIAGHTPGSIALLYDDPEGHPHLFTGDSLFPGGPGRTTDEGSFAQIMDELEIKVFQRLPDETWFYPGHGNDSTLGAERPSLGQWRARGW